MACTEGCEPARGSQSQKACLSSDCSLQPETAQHSLADELGLEAIDTPEWYEALDWLLARQTRIENKLAKKSYNFV